MLNLDISCFENSLDPDQLAYQNPHCFPLKSACKCILTLNAPIATKVVCFSRLLKSLRSLYGKQYINIFTYRSSLFWVHAVCFHISFVSNVRQLFAVDDFNRRHFQMLFFLGALRANNWKIVLYKLSFLADIWKDFRTGSEGQHLTESLLQ